jgi:3-dehydroshikimate dehydratase
MIKSGLVSVSFRNLSVDKVIEAVKTSGLMAIEWGGDVHVPHGDLKKAKEVKEATIKAGLEVAAYGSYYKAGESIEAGLSFESVLDTAVELGAPTIRVWAGNRDSGNANDSYRRKVADDLIRIGTLAEKKNKSISLEYHVHTLTDSNESAVKLIKEVNHGNVMNYWQPPVNTTITHGDCINGLKAVLHKLTNIHVYQWVYENDQYIRFPLIDGFQYWKEYFDIVKTTNKDLYAMLEFIKDDSLEQLKKDADTLNKLINE